MTSKKNGSGSVQGSQTVVASGPVSDETFMKAIEPHLKSGDRAKALAVAAEMGIGVNYFNSRLSKIRKAAEKAGAEIPMFKRGRAASGDNTTLADYLKATFAKAE